MVILYIYGGISGGGCMDEGFHYMVPKDLKIFFFLFFFFLEGSSLVEGGGAGENVKA